MGEDEGAQLYDLFNDVFQEEDTVDEIGFVVMADAKGCGLAGTGARTVELGGRACFLLVRSEGDAKLRAKGAAAPAEGGALWLKFAIAFWCIPPLYRHALGLARDLRRRFSILQEGGRSHGEGAEAGARPEGEDVRALEKALRCVLLLSCDNYSMWNVRRRMVVAGLSAVERELSFVDLCFTKHPKSAMAWEHRGWLCRHYEAEVLHREGGLADELAVAQRVAELYPKNYYAWTYRGTLLRHMRTAQAVAEDLARMRAWLRRHVGDHCAFHHRQRLLLRLLALSSPPLHDSLLRAVSLFSSCRSVSPPLSDGACWHGLSRERDPSSHGVSSSSSGDVSDCDVGSSSHGVSLPSSGDGSERDVGSPVEADSGEWRETVRWWKKELMLVHSLSTFYPGHEALWCHRRFLLLHWWMLVHLTERAPPAVVSALREAVEFEEDLDDEEQEEALSLMWPTEAAERSFLATERGAASRATLRKTERLQCVSRHERWLSDVGSALSCLIPALDAVV